jgi:CSLREA domain-containing protein
MSIMNTFRRVDRWIPSRWVPLFLAFFLFFCACPATPLEQEAVAATLTVNTLADNTVNGDGLCTLREAILAAVTDDDFNDCSGTDYGNDTIIFSVTGVIQLGGELPPVTGAWPRSAAGSSLTISGPGSDQLTISGDTDGDGLGNVRVLTVNAVANFKLENVTLANGFSTVNGGGVLADGTGNFYATDCAFSNHRAVQGGALYLDALNIFITGCLFSDNNALTGGAIAAVNTLINNFNLTQSTFLNNQASENGGGLYLRDSAFWSTDSFFTNNGALLGGGIYQEGGTLSSSKDIFSNNHATDGGGIYALGGNLGIRESTFYQNVALSRAGGIYTGINCIITGSTFEGNQAESGGALQANSNVSIQNTTLYNNQAGQQGGGVLSLGNMHLQNTTFFANGASNGGGFKNGDPAKVTSIHNTIIAGSPSGGNCSGLTPASNMGNNIDSGTTCDWGSDNGSLSDTDPALMPLADNGGPTKTMALKPGSPAINGVVYNAQNSCPPKDQRGVDRPQDLVCDIGAFEFFWRYAYLPLIQN